MSRPSLKICVAERDDPLDLDRRREEFKAIALAKFNQARNRYDPRHLHQERIVDSLAHWVSAFAAAEREKVPVLS